MADLERLESDEPTGSLVDLEFVDLVDADELGQFAGSLQGDQHVRSLELWGLPTPTPADGEMGLSLQKQLHHLRLLICP